MSVMTARRSDPITSQISAEPTMVRATQADHLLATYVDVPWGLTAEEAAQKAGLTHIGYWKRISDLFNRGLITEGDQHDTRPGTSGRPQRVLYITPKGEQHIANLAEVR